MQEIMIMLGLAIISMFVLSLKLNKSTDAGISKQEEEAFAEMSDEYCFGCKKMVQIPRDTITICEGCGAVIFPCTLCEKGYLCDYDMKTSTCGRFPSGVAK